MSFGPIDFWREHLPMEPGFYWHMGRVQGGCFSRPRITRVGHPPGEFSHLLFGDMDGVHPTLVEHMPGLWAGPVPQPCQPKSTPQKVRPQIILCFPKDREAMMALLNAEFGEDGK